jgi:hypothetical protein
MQEADAATRPAPSVRVKSRCRQNNAKITNASATKLKAVADAPNTATRTTNGENLMSAIVSGPSEPAAEYGF